MFKTTSVRHRFSVMYFSSLLVLLLFLGAYRDGPVYGKLDFILLDSKPWWPAWKPMIEKVLRDNNGGPVWTDPTTSSVLNAVFNQETRFFRRFWHYPYLIVEKMDRKNRPRFLKDTRSQPPKQPVASYRLLLFGDGSGYAHGTMKGEVVDEIEYDELDTPQLQSAEKKKKRPYRCVVNVRGFKPSWVPFETGHWNPRLASTDWFYLYHGHAGAGLVLELRKHPPKNCYVFY